MKLLLIPAISLLICGNIYSQNGLEEVKKRFAEMEQMALDKPYEGIYTDSGIITGLYSIHPTNVSTAPIVSAANTFISTLTDEERNRVLFRIDSEEWRKWSNVDNGIYIRQGMSLKEMSESQKEAAFALMQSSLSAKGLQLSRDIMKTDQTLKEFNDNAEYLDEELYFLTIMGVPSENEPWGWQLDGHHLVINYFVLGDQVVMSPVFMGAEPVITTSGQYVGNTLFQDEQNLGLLLIQSFSAEQQAKAIVSSDKPANNNVGEANKDNQVLNYIGINASELTAEQLNGLKYLIEQYISNMREGHDEIRMEEILEHLDDTWFAWVGDTSEEAVFYYRIHSPVVLIEFDHQRPVGAPAENRRMPTRNHIHTVVRTPNGNDYGKDLLRQHLEAHHSADHD